MKNFAAFVLMSAFETYLPENGAIWTPNVKDARILSASEVLLLMDVHKKLGTDCCAIRANVGYQPEDLTKSAEFSSSLVAA